MNVEDIIFLDDLADRISNAIYNGDVKTHHDQRAINYDDADKLKKITQKAKLSDWNKQHGIE